MTLALVIDIDVGGLFFVIDRGLSLDIGISRLPLADFCLYPLRRRKISVDLQVKTFLSVLSLPVKGKGSGKGLLLRPV